MVKVQSDVGTYAQLPRWLDLLYIMSLYGKSGVSTNPSATIYTTNGEIIIQGDIIQGNLKGLKKPLYAFYYASMYVVVRTMWGATNQQRFILHFP